MAQEIDTDPRNDCLGYLIRKGVEPEDATLVQKVLFEKLARTNEFRDGPYQCDFGNGHGEPYNVHHQGFGQLHNGRVIYTELYRDRHELGVSELPEI
jgi:hypothetical protein